MAYQLVAPKVALTAVTMVVLMVGLWVDMLVEKKGTKMVVVRVDLMVVKMVDAWDCM